MASWWGIGAEKGFLPQMGERPSPEQVKKVAPPMVDCCGRGIGEDGEAERPPLVFSMAEMERGGCLGVPEALSWCAG